MACILPYKHGTCRLGGPLTTIQLLAAIKADGGVKFSSSNEKNELSNYLSRSDLFDNRRLEGGWFLKR